MPDQARHDELARIGSTMSKSPGRSGLARPAVQKVRKVRLTGGRKCIFIRVKQGETLPGADPIRAATRRVTMFAEGGAKGNKGNDHVTPRNWADGVAGGLQRTRTIRKSTAFWGSNIRNPGRAVTGFGPWCGTGRGGRLEDGLHRPAWSR